ncbi:DUF2935 domain-containing protein [Thermosediminibacter litoriperuensis]|uniref:DUF2935 family protein n=1 Tax=Thermosediminibacter litoriperuensis TaxID=291989 RepID=A0A5S5AGU9_9FIRM|nr:DUF2935 domain-containing protein [Thermosediminibacter litoriperuensis]TYP49224.1 protein of unknown function (DUF2935) [Thermosediminibacter litoriperuensis]
MDIQHDLSLRREIDFWVEIMKDHARFMRNGFDPTEEFLFNESDEFFRRFNFLTGQLELEHDGAGMLLPLQNLVLDFIDFKGRVAAGIRDCRILSILPAELVDHIRREALFFFGILARVKGGPRPSRRELNIPGEGTASTAPQVLIPRLQGEFREIAFDELFFWLQISFEHAGVLALYFRPGQEPYMRETLRWERRIRRLYNEVGRAFRASRSPKPFIPISIAIMKQWAVFLQRLFTDLVRCTIPGRQMNVWPRLIDHMIRENNYFIEILEILQRMRG